MENYFKRIDTTQIHSSFYLLCEKLIENLHMNGTPFFAISGFRSHEEQNQLYKQGRSLPGKIVTNAKGGQSLHNFGLAIDFCFDSDIKKEGLQPSWESKKYDVLGKECKKIGLIWGGDFKSIKDSPHVEFDIVKLGLSLKDLQNSYNKGGMASVKILLKNKEG
jgi:peptidoglycan L-alanyl-D-glutamate endopeptidase CwlK